MNHGSHQIPSAPKALQNLETVWKAVDVQPLIEVLPQHQFFQAASTGSILISDARCSPDPKRKSKGVKLEVEVVK